MSKRLITISLLVALAAAVGWVVFRHTRPYDPAAEPVGGISILGASVTRDRSFYWLDLELDGVSSLQNIPPDFHLCGHNGRKLEAATWSWPKATVQGKQARANVRFWLDSRDLAATLAIETATGSLDVKRNRGLARVADGRTRRFRSPTW